MRHLFCTLNLKGAFGGMPYDHARHDLERVTRFATETYGFRPTVLGLQEMMPEAYDQALADALPSYRAFHPRHLSPAAAFDPARYEVQQRLAPAGHPAVPGVCNERPILILRLKDLANGDLLSVIVTHPVPGAFLGKPHALARRRAWLLWRKRMCVWTAHEVRDGRNVVILTDANRTKPRWLGRRVAGRRVQVVRHHIDFLIFVSTHGYRWRVSGSRRVAGLFTDHLGLLALADLVRVAR